MGDGYFRNIAILRKLVNFSASLNSANFPVIKRALAKVVSVPGRLLSSCKYTSTCPKVFLKMSRGHFLKHKKWKNKFYLNSGKHERLIGILKKLPHKCIFSHILPLLLKFTTRCQKSIQYMHWVKWNFHWTHLARLLLTDMHGNVDIMVIGYKNDVSDTSTNIFLNSLSLKYMFLIHGWHFVTLLLTNQITEWICKIEDFFEMHSGFSWDCKIAKLQNCKIAKLWRNLS